MGSLSFPLFLQDQDTSLSHFPQRCELSQCSYLLSLKYKYCLMFKNHASQVICVLASQKYYSCPPCNQFYANDSQNVSSSGVTFMS